MWRSFAPVAAGHGCAALVSCNSMNEPHHFRPVMSGTVCLGFMVRTCKGIDAYDPAGNPLAHARLKKITVEA
jgi:hypothetical protein